MNVNLFNKTEAEQLKILNIVNILPLTYRLLYHYLCFIFIIMPVKNRFSALQRTRVFER